MNLYRNQAPPILIYSASVTVLHVTYYDMIELLMKIVYK